MPDARIASCDVVPTRQLRADKKLQRRELDVPATPIAGGGRTEPQKPELGGERNREGVGNLVSGDKTLMESPERGKSVARIRARGQRQDKTTRRNARRKTCCQLRFAVASGCNFGIQLVLGRDFDFADTDNALGYDSTDH